MIFSLVVGPIVLVFADAVMGNILTMFTRDDSHPFTQEEVDSFKTGAGGSMD
jgi:hypothetical protein